MDPQKKIGFIGGGNMAKAICEGGVRKGVLCYSNVMVSGPHLEHLTEWQSKGARITCKNGELAQWADIIFIAVKPHILQQAIDNIASTANVSKINNKLFVSILAGVTLETLKQTLKPFNGARIIRVMPNTPMMVGEGCTVFSPSESATSDDEKQVSEMMAALGICHKVPESMINPIGALSGSGPAYVYTVIEAMSDGAVRMGVPRQLATQFAAQTVFGAAKLVLETGKHTGELKDEVCSTGGSTIAGIHELERGGVRAAFMNAIQAASLRSEELGKK